MTYTINSRSYVSPNYDARPSGMAIEAIVIHTTEGAWDSDAAWLCNPASQVSCHYVIPPTNTTVYQLVSDAARAWHAGQSSYQGRSNFNDFSIGIEISHKQGQPWATGQQDLTASLCRDLIARYHIPESGIVAHRWVATPAGRKVDPTDWSDSDFKAWIAKLYTPTVRPYRFRFPQAVFTDRRPDAPLASGPDNGAEVFNAGEVVQIGDITDGWGWVNTGIGFVPMSILEPV